MDNSKLFPNIPVKVSTESVITDDRRVISKIADAFGSVESFDGNIYKINYFFDFDVPTQVSVASTGVIPVTLPPGLVKKFVKELPNYSHEPNLESSVSWIVSLMMRVLIFSFFHKNHINKRYLDLIKRPTETEIDFISGFGFFHKIYDSLSKNHILSREKPIAIASLDIRNWGDSPPFNSLNPCVCKRLAMSMIQEEQFFVSVLSRTLHESSFSMSLKRNLYQAYAGLPGINNRFAEPIWNARPSSFFSCQHMNFETQRFDEDIFSHPDSLRFTFIDSRVICISRTLIQRQLEESVRTKRQIFVPVSTKTKQYILNGGFYYNIFIGMPFNFLITQESYLSIFKQKNVKKNLSVMVAGFFDFVELIDAINEVENPQIHTEFFYDILV